MDKYGTAIKVYLAGTEVVPGLDRLSRRSILDFGFWIKTILTPDPCINPKVQTCISSQASKPLKQRKQAP
jgi:hypothetical protein